MAGKKRSSKRERGGILSQYRASGLTQREFAEREGVAISTLSYWLRRERVESELTGDTALVAVTNQTPSSVGAFVLEFGGLRIEVPRDASIEDWQKLKEVWATC